VTTVRFGRDQGAFAIQSPPVPPPHKGKPALFYVPSACSVTTPFHHPCRPNHMCSITGTVPLPHTGAPAQVLSILPVIPPHCHPFPLSFSEPFFPFCVNQPQWHDDGTKCWALVPSVPDPHSLRFRSSPRAPGLTLTMHGLNARRLLRAPCVARVINEASAVRRATSAFANASSGERCVRVSSEGNLEGLPVADERGWEHTCTVSPSLHQSHVV